MQFALLTDIHGNAVALQAVLQDIKERGVDEVYCTGDLIGIGHQSNEVLQLLSALPHCEIVCGNHDEAALAIIEGQPYPKSHAGIRAFVRIMNGLRQGLTRHLFPFYSSCRAK